MELFELKFIEVAGVIVDDDDDDTISTKNLHNLNTKL